MKYWVSISREGRNATRTPDGVIVDCGRGHPACELIWEGGKRTEAFAIADKQPIRAIVTPMHSAEIIYDNKKPVGDRIRDISVDEEPAPGARSSP